MVQLNLPAFAPSLRRTDKGQIQIFDPLRSKYVALTPEEWVRQHFVNFLAEHRAYPAALMANEVGLRHNGCARRCDTIVYDRHARPAAIVEYKAPEVEITERVFDQIARYNMVLGVGVLMVSNGLRHFCCRVDAASRRYAFMRDIPTYDSLVTL